MNKGFKSLPENVQRKIDPEMAKKYMGGGAVMDRPLFRQAGGPAARSPEEMAAMGQQYLMQPPAAAPQGEADAMAMLQQGEAAGMAQGQQMGEMYGEATMANLDAADDPKSLIDAIRGNAAPLEARYTELAGLVGEQDAQQTPESVLALVQPTIMMTEEGAVDSGIGELMKGLMGEVEMSEGSGMSQGVGELMAMGAGNTPPANFNQGGPVEVRRFQDGGSVISEAQRMAPEFQKYFEGSFDQQARAAALQEQREMSQAQMLFDIAGTALNFAGNTQGRSIAERLANAAAQTQLTDKIGTRAAGMLSAKQAQAAEDRQMRMAGLQASLGQAQTNKAAADALELAAAKAKPAEAKYQRLVGANGEKLGTFNVSTPAGAADLDAAIKNNPDATLYNVGTEPADSRKPDLKIVVSGAGEQQTFDLSTVEGKAAFEVASKKDGAKVYNVGSAPTDTGFKTITLYDPNNPTVPVTKPINTKDERQVVSDLLTKSGYTTDDKVAAATIADQFAVKKEERDLATTIAAEKRLESTTISKEDRAVLMAIASEGRATQRVIDTEARLLETTLGSEARKLATLEAQEARDELAAIRRENRAIEAQIAAEKRDLATTIAAEDRAVARETVVYGRDRADELADIAAQVQSTIESEERALGRALNAEERAQTTFVTRQAIIQENDLARLAAAQGLRDASQISAEDRAAVVEQNNFERDQAAQVAKENRAVANRDTIELREINGELVRVDTLTGETEVIFGDPTVPDPSMAQVTLPNADGVPVTTVIDITSPQGKALIEQVNAANTAAPGSASYQKVPTASTTVQGYLIYNEDGTTKGVYTSYDGKTYIDEDGNAQKITGGSHPVNDTIAYDVAKNEKLVAGARSQLEALDSEIISQMTTFDKDGKPILLNKQQQNEVRDAFAAARKGTGFWSKVYAGIDAVAGGLAPGLFSDMFKDTTDARQFVKMVRVLGRSALASSPRFAMGDLNTVQELFPNEQALLRSASTEMNKLNDIVFYLDEEKRRLLGEIASGKPLDSTMKSQINQKLFEINRLETILGPVAMLGQASENAADFDAAVDTMTKARQRAKDAAAAQEDP